MNPEFVEEQIAASHALIQTKPRDRLDYIKKTNEIKQVILGCVNFLGQLNKDSEKDLEDIHEAVCVSAIPLLDTIERFLEVAKEKTPERHFAV